MSKNLQEKIKEVKSSIVAIGFNPNPQQITIVGSGFAVSDDGKILTAAQLYNQLNPEQINNLKANIMIKQEANELEQYRWFPIKMVNKNDKDDLIVFQVDNCKETLLKKLELGDSDKIMTGDDVYFIGFPYAAQLMNEGFGVTLIVNKGIVSNTKRDGTDPSRRRNWLIVDAISNPGNSGCPLFDVETNKVIGVMTIAFRTQSKVQPNLDIREPMHIAGAKPINLAKDLLK